MIVLRALEASFEDARAGRIGPFNFSLRDGERCTLEASSPRAASIAARMCAAIVKPSHGAVYVGDYDTRLQPPQAKRRLGFVDAGGFTGNAHAFACEINFRADVWGLDPWAARHRARDLLSAFAACDARHARAIALALVARVGLIVLDQPISDVCAAIASAAPHLAIVDTRVALAVPRPALSPVPA